MEARGEVKIIEGNKEHLVQKGTEKNGKFKKLYNSVLGQDSCSVRLLQINTSMYEGYHHFDISLFEHSPGYLQNFS